eukprot:m.332017 g.332017  ORF g.332017 m.332017 type:complete len:246 (+) comp16852_c0_seq1:23-760(+)
MAIILLLSLVGLAAAAPKVSPSFTSDIVVTTNPPNGTYDGTLAILSLSLRTALAKQTPNPDTGSGYCVTTPDVAFCGTASTCGYSCRNNTCCPNPPPPPPSPGPPAPNASCGCALNTAAFNVFRFLPLAEDDGKCECQGTCEQYLLHSFAGKNIDSGFDVQTRNFLKMFQPPPPPPAPSPAGPPKILGIIYCIKQDSSGQAIPDHITVMEQEHNGDHLNVTIKFSDFNPEKPSMSEFVPPPTCGC